MSSINPDHHAGAEWVAARIGAPLSPLGVKVADLLGYLFAGVYHIDRAVLRADWSNPSWIVVILRYETLSTFDNSLLTRLVFLAHHLALRVEVTAAAPNLLRLTFHQRRREGRIFERHPSLQEAVAAFEKEYAFLAEEGYGNDKEEERHDLAGGGGGGGGVGCVPRSADCGAK